MMETRIVWLEDPLQFEYLREQLFLVRGRRRNPGYRGKGRIIGYACVDLTAKGHNGHFWRRVWWIAPWDPYGGREQRGHPTEAVIPESIMPNRPSKPSTR